MIPGGTALLVEQDLGKLGTGKGVVRPEPSIAVPVHQALLLDEPHRLIVPIALRHIGKGVIPGCFNGLVTHFNFHFCHYENDCR